MPYGEQGRDSSCHQSADTGSTPVTCLLTPLTLSIMTVISMLDTTVLRDYYIIITSLFCPYGASDHAHSEMCTTKRWVVITQTCQPGLHIDLNPRSLIHS